MNALKQKLNEGSRLLGCIQMIPSADVSEILAVAGFDFLMIDHEHGLGGVTDVVAQLRSLKGTATDALVRVPSNDESYARRLLDAGVNSILFPSIEDASVARALVGACRYPPNGKRGAGGGLRASNYDHNPDYYARALEETLIGIQIETKKGIENLSEIASVDGIDLIVIGPRDLSASVGKLNRFEDAEVKELFAEAERRVSESGRIMGSVIYPGLTARDMFDRGHRLLLAGSDVGLFGRAAKAVIEGVR